MLAAAAVSPSGKQRACHAVPSAFFTIVSVAALSLSPQSWQYAPAFLLRTFRAFFKPFFFFALRASRASPSSPASSFFCFFFFFRFSSLIISLTESFPPTANDEDALPFFFFFFAAFGCAAVPPAAASAGAPSLSPAAALSPSAPGAAVLDAGPASLSPVPLLPPSTHPPGNFAIASLRDAMLLCACRHSMKT